MPGRRARALRVSVFAACVSLLGLVLAVASCWGGGTLLVVEGTPVLPAASPTGAAGASTPRPSRPSPTPTPEPLTSLDGVPVTVLTIGEPLPLAPGVALYLDEGGASGLSRILRVTARPDGTLILKDLSAFTAAYAPPDPEARADFGITSWTGDERMTELYAMLCLGKPDGCSCAAGFRAEPPGSLLFHSVDGGTTWSVAGEFGHRDRVIGMDGTKMITGNQSGCSTLGPFSYWEEPGHVPIVHPGGERRQAESYGLLPGIGWFWSRAADGLYQQDGSPAVTLPVPGLGTAAQVAADRKGKVYWHASDGAWRYLVQTGTSGAVLGAWRWRDGTIRVAGVAGPKLLYGSLLKEDPGNPDPRRRSEEIPVLIDLTAGTIRPIRGLVPGEGDPGLRLRAVVVD